MLWAIFEPCAAACVREGLITYAEMFTRLAVADRETARHPPFDFVVVDEAQDLSVAQLRFLAALGGNGRTACSSRAISASASFSSHSPGNRWASISAAARAPCTSTTARRTRSECRLTSAGTGSCGC